MTTVTQLLETIRNRQAVNRDAINAFVDVMLKVQAEGNAERAAQVYALIVERGAENRTLDKQAAYLLKYQ